MAGSARQDTNAKLWLTGYGTMLFADGRQIITALKNNRSEKRGANRSFSK
jgi:hypothetical protein